MQSEIYEQGSPRWHAERLGRITASPCGCLLVNGKTKDNRILPVGFGAGAETYAVKLLDELLTGLPSDIITSWDMEYGNTYEPMARKQFIETYFPDDDCYQASFVNHPELQLVGCSPDLLIGSEGGAEFKSRSKESHSRLLLEQDYWAQLGEEPEVPKENMPQVQFCMWVTERQWWYYGSFNPQHPRITRLVTIRVERDEMMIKKLAERAAIMQDAVIAAYQRITGSTEFEVDIDRLSRFLSSSPSEKLRFFLEE